MNGESLNEPKRERPSGLIHNSIRDAIRHAEERLQCRGSRMSAYWGRMPDNHQYIVGFEVNARKRWRLDYDPGKGMHVNEENFDAAFPDQKILHPISGGERTGFMQVLLQWRKWTSGATSIPERVKEEIAFYSRLRRR